MTYVYNQQSEDVLSSLAESSTETGHIGIGIPSYVLFHYFYLGIWPPKDTSLTGMNFLAHLHCSDSHFARAPNSL